MLLLALALFLTPPAPSPDDAGGGVEPVTSIPDTTRSRVRPLDDPARTIVQTGGESSPTVVQLLTTLERSNVVVYVRTAVGLRTRGVLTFVAHGGPLTYVLIRIDLAQNLRDRVSTLAHELTHAAEIAEANPPILTEEDLAALYQKIGAPGRRTGDFESSRALANEHRARLDQKAATVSGAATGKGSRAQI